MSEILPGPTADTDGAIADYVRQAVGPYHHPADTCAMGEVVDEALRVHGLDNIRIADASAIARLPSVAPQLLCQALGWRAAELMLSRRQSLLAAG